MKIKNIIILILVFIFGVSFCGNMAFAKSKKKRTVKVLEISTKDELLLSAKLILPKDATAKHKVPLVIFLHSLGGSGVVYEPMAMQLRDKDIASLILSSRGHPQSLTYMSGRRSYWQNFSDKQFAKYPSDIVDCIEFIKQNYVSVDTNRIAIVGSDVNANAAILAAVQGGRYNVKTLVLFSPALSFKGMEVRHSLVKYGNRPVMILVSKNDKSHYNSANELYKYAQGRVELVALNSGGTGDNIIKTNPAIKDKILNWIVAYVK